MAIKTISLELDAYEKLRNAKRGGESFSAVVRRAKFDEPEGLVGEPKAAYGAKAGSAEAEEDYWDRIEESKRIEVALDSFDAATKRQQERNKRWKGKRPAGGVRWTREDYYQEDS